MWLTATIDDFIHALDSDAPSPGGGSAAAAAGAIGCALGRMFGHLSAAKKAFQKLDSAQQQDFLAHWNRLEQLQQQLADGIDADTQLYPMVLQAYRLPKDTVEHSAYRQQQIQHALMQAMDLPWRMANQAYQAMLEIEALIPTGNPAVISDAACCVILLAACVETSLYNVRINAMLLEEETTKREMLNRQTQLLHDTMHKKQAICAMCDARM